MKINRVEVIYPKTQDTHIYTLDNNNQLLAGKTKRLPKHLEYCFGVDSSSQCDVTVTMDVNGDTYVLSRTHQDNTSNIILQRMVMNVGHIVAQGQEAYQYMQELLGCSLLDVLNANYVNNVDFQSFDGDIGKLSAIKVFQGIASKIDQSSVQLQQRREAVRQQAVSAMGEYKPSVTIADIENVTAKIADNANETQQLNAKLMELKATHATSVVTGEILSQLGKAQAQYDVLIQQKDYIDTQRNKADIHDKIADILPKVDKISLLDKQMQEIAMSKSKLTKELDWKDNELSSANSQLEVKQQQVATILNKNNKIEIINQELATIAKLYSDNKQHNESLFALSEQEQRLQAEKTMWLNKLTQLDSRIVDMKKHIDNFSVPEQSIGELIEGARVDVKVDEVQAQIDKLTSELSVKESQIAEKESQLVVQVKKFRMVAELDVAVSPIKAKDTILQVLQTKYNKLEKINSTLLDKQRNLQRMLEDYRYRILELEHSRTTLQRKLAEMVNRKQEEFKREVYLNSQKIYTDDASAVLAVTTDLNDQEVLVLQQDIDKRNVDRDVLLERASALQGQIDTITRQMDINSAEMATLRGEKANINARYNDIITNNRSDVVFNYLKALESNNGTRYLLDTQHDAVRNEAELAEAKRYADALRTKLSGLHSRMRYLLDTQSNMASGVTLDSVVASNDRMRQDLADIGDQLSSAYQQHLSVMKSLEACETRLSEVIADIMELTKTIKVNDKQIQLAQEKAQTYAGSEDLEQAISNFRYEITDVESERQMLVEAKKALEKDVFRMRIELEKLQYLYTSKQTERDAIREDVVFQLSLHGLTIEGVREMGYDTNMDTTRQVIARFDDNKAELTSRIDNYYSLLASHQHDHVVLEDVVAEIAYIQDRLTNLYQDRLELENRRDTCLADYATANNSKIRYAVAATSAEALSGIAEAIEHNSIIKVLVEDKVSAVVHKAEGIMDTIIDNIYNLSVVDGAMNVTSGNVKVYYQDMPLLHQFALYLSLVLACPDVDSTRGRVILLDDKLPLEQQHLVDMLSRMEGLCYITNFEIVKGAKQ